MAICVRCTQCGNDYRLNTPVCHKCWNNLRKYRKFKVVVRYPNGTWRTQVLTSLLKARKIETAWRQEARAERSARGKAAMPLDKIWDQYIAWAQSRKKTWRDDLCRWQKHIAPMIGHLAIDQISATDIKRIIERMQNTAHARGRKYRPATLHHVTGLVQRVLNWASQEGLFDGPLPIFQRRAPRRLKPELYILTREEIAQLLQAMHRWRHERAALLIQFLLFSGRRKGEALALQWQDVDRRYRRVRFQRRLRDRTFTQTIPINTHCNAVLQRAWQIRLGDLVFPSRMGNFFHSFDKAWHRLRRREGFRFLIRDFRSTFAYYALSAGGVDLNTLGALMGHTHPTTTQRYAHLAHPTTLSAVGSTDAAFAQFRV